MNHESWSASSETLGLLLPPLAPPPSFFPLVQDSAVNKHDSNCNQRVFIFSSVYLYPAFWIIWNISSRSKKLRGVLFLRKNRVWSSLFRKNGTKKTCFIIYTELNINNMMEFSIINFWAVWFILKTQFSLKYFNLWLQTFWWCVQGPCGLLDGGFYISELQLRQLQC